ncbi:hypothetical protein GCM10009551_095900 [Nocardiopsis tropica]
MFLRGLGGVLGSTDSLEVDFNVLPDNSPGVANCDVSPKVGGKAWAGTGPCGTAPTAEVDVPGAGRAGRNRPG